MLSRYFAARKRLYPQKVKGRFRNLKWALNSVFISIFLLAPFIRFDRGEGAPNQAILIDLPGSIGYFFSIEMWPEETYYLMGILVIAAVALFFVTSLLGRIWCGYACPQTVWTDIFVALEGLFQGDRNERILLDRKNNFEKFYKKFLTHLSWIIVSLLTGYGFVCYFNDSVLLTKNLFIGRITLNQLGWILGIAGSTYIMAGFAREHVCTYMCPYARFQSAMFDINTLLITYDEKRGEPRGKHKQGDSFENRGHCIDCKQCVVVCPTGIDIRNGLQMECIACGLCVDACDNVMEKVGLPKGLIRYDTLSHLLDPTTKNKFRILRPRTFFYATILLVASGLLAYSLLMKSKFEASVDPDRNPLFVTLSNGSIRNGYTVKISNKSHKQKMFQVAIIKPQGALMKFHDVQTYDPITVEIAATGSETLKIYTILSREFVEKNEEGRGVIEFVVSDMEEKEEKRIEAVFVGR